MTAGDAARIQALQRTLNTAMARGAIRRWTYDPAGHWRVEAPAPVHGLAQRWLTVDQVELLAVGLAAAFTAGLTIPEDAWREHGQQPDPANPAAAQFHPSDRLSATVTINETLFFAEAYALVQDDEQPQAAIQDDDDLELHHQAAHADGPFPTMTIWGREYAVVLTPYC